MTVHALSVPYAAIDPGIRGTVRWLTEHGFRTTDSGDGVSKADLIASGYALAVPHVFMRCEPSDLLAESHRLRTLLDRAVPGDPIGHVEATYSPDDGVAMLCLYEVNDVALRVGEEPGR